MDKQDCEWESGDKSGLVSIGTHKLYTEIRGPSRLPSQPVVIIFPGSGAACDTWKSVSTQIASFARVLLYDRAGIGRSERGPDRDTGYINARELSKLLKAIGVKGPYVLVAHSYGGCVAREFLHLHSREVVGMVLSETGTEPKCEHAEEQYKTQILGDSPLSVIRGEAAFSRSFKSSKHLTNEQDQQGDNADQLHRKILQNMEEMDIQLKKEQLKLSRKSKFRNVPDCGHSVHLDRPEVVVEEAQWVLENIVDGGFTKSMAPSLTPTKLGLVSRLYNKISQAGSKR